MYGGQGFEVSKKIVFKDFEVGQVYVEHRKLINISWSFNSFKILPLSEEFQRCFEISYKPPGRISAGIDVPLKIMFFPQSRQNISTSIPILCQTGRQDQNEDQPPGQISIPVECFYKKTEVLLEESNLDFGKTILEETKVKQLRLKNVGGMSSLFEVRNSEGKNVNSSMGTVVSVNEIGLEYNFF